ncbi:extracellular solute-binding protein [Paenibacillus sp. OAS669]|uniref:extracellular solute-binding protein n=1 Tax=Paenibacillus sp. OAS669 TaxID=2663821 RepID=UPI00178B9FF2|nr:extracellular solute-binding protein [Paenibacillus sp. OAS669]MBE1445741.1 putative spermidine/putrescine transport system substrate-binding protein [Paenibacillus sp. OAS669]
MKKGLKQIRVLKGKTLVLAAAAIVVALSGCGKVEQAATNGGAVGAAQSGGAKPVEINFYFSGSANVKEMWETLAPQFEKANPEIKVKLVHLPDGQAEGAAIDKVLGAKKAGQKSIDIDVFETGLSNLTKGEKDGVWQKLDQSMIPNLGKVDSAYMNDVHQLAVPYRASSVVLAYNSKNVPEPPKTADELYDWIRKHPGKFAYNDPATGGSGSSFVQTAIYNFLPPEAIHNEDPAIMKQWDKGFALLKELGPSMYQKGVYPKKNQGTMDILASGEVDMIPAWSDMALEQLSKKMLPDTIKLTQIQPAFTGGPSYIAIPAMSEKKEAAQKFINYALTPEAQTVVINKMYGYPGIKWSEMPQELQKKFESVAKGYRTFTIGSLGDEINKRWQREVAGGN